MIDTNDSTYRQLRACLADAYRRHDADGSSDADFTKAFDDIQALLRVAKMLWDLNVVDQLMHDSYQQSFA